ncbi:permease [Planctomicrobium piriforme]|uniref:Putative MFS transporter, AGZA family, xanthine/uracil permease n=1 Tax=Planctomicrobium piriforme TaxID=1576369 RepID=A0A1I3KVD4_9PLAN|nr:permease [Planctomicrobium piriforme]SFI76407.1 putative MFS transporter, AGZA family, xanthine/uracil permease [Planctomicrobium piriforme]
MRVFVKRDLDGFCGLFVDNLVQLLLIVGLGAGLCGMSSDLLFRVILPGTAISILLGNVFYAWQAHRLAKKTGRDDVTALPFGINTPSLIVFVFFVIKPEFDRTGDAMAAWRMGLLACLGSGVIEFVGAFVAEPIRRVTPRAALLSTLAGIAIGFISMTFALQIFNKPLIAMLPLAIVLVGLFSRVSLPLGLPSGFVAVLVGTATAWLMVPLMKIAALPDWVTYGAANVAAVTDSLAHVHWSPPVWCGETILDTLKAMDKWVPFLSVVIPMGLFNVVGSLQNIESAEAAGDKYSTMPSMAVNGIATIVAALLGSCFPTTIYIGHPGWKALGARAGYSTLNGLVITGLALFGLVGLVAAVVPIEAGAAIVLWIGIIITAQAFQATPNEHAPAVAVGLFPAIAAWGATVMMGAFGIAGGQTLQQVVSPAAVVAAEGETATPPPAKPKAEVNGFLVHGLLLMERGYIFTCMILAAASACLIDRKFGAASVWMLFAALFTGLGVMHAYQIYTGFAFDYLFRFVTPAEGAFAYRADDIAIGYLLCAIFFFLIGRWAKDQPVGAGH